MHKVNKIIDEAYELYMPQIRSEIVNLSSFLLGHFKTDGRKTEGNVSWSIPREPLLSVLEIGTKFGGTFYIWNKINELRREKLHPDIYTKKDRTGICISIDMSDGGKHGGISEEEMDKRDLWFQERFDNVHFIRGNSHDRLTRYKLIMLAIENKIEFDVRVGDDIGQIHMTPFVDFLFIDGDHTKEGVAQDFDMYSPLVKKGGIICFHDIVISDHHHSRDVYVGEFWNEIKTQYRHIEFVEEGNNWGGIGCLFM